MEEDLGHGGPLSTSFMGQLRKTPARWGGEGHWGAEGKMTVNGSGVPFEMVKNVLK